MRAASRLALVAHARDMLLNFSTLLIIGLTTNTQDVPAILSSIKYGFTTRKIEFYWDPKMATVEKKQTPITTTSRFHDGVFQHDLKLALFPK